MRGAFRAAGQKVKGGPKPQQTRDGRHHSAPRRGQVQGGQGNAGEELHIPLSIAEKLVKKYAAKRKSLLDEFNAAKDPMERLEIHRKIQGLPRNSAPNRVRNRCWATGKPRGVYRDFGLCRNQLRQRAHNGELPGVVKSSW